MKAARLDQIRYIKCLSRKKSKYDFYDDEFDDDNDDFDDDNDDFDDDNDDDFDEIIEKKKKR